ncbi:transmembrane ascorbate ferrireductase [Salix suchowensis]|nr:transmembrane ascorbate ferrireductase [Salix suchowensis]
MAIGVEALPLTFAAHALAVAGAAMVLVWNLHYRGGLAWEATNKNLIFNLHPVLMLIGLIIIGGEAIMSYKSLPLKKEVKKQSISSPCCCCILGSVGIAAAFKNHNESNIPTYTACHSWIGISIIFLYSNPGSTARRSKSLPWHVLFGILLYILAVGNAALGFLEKLTFLQSSGIARRGPEALLVNFTAVITILYGVFVILSVLSRAPEEDDDSYSAK